MIVDCSVLGLAQQKVMKLNRVLTFQLLSATLNKGLISCLSVICVPLHFKLPEIDLAHAAASLLEIVAASQEHSLFRDVKSDYKDALNLAETLLWVTAQITKGNT